MTFAQKELKLDLSYINDILNSSNMVEVVTTPNSTPMVLGHTKETAYPLTPPTAIQIIEDDEDDEDYEYENEHKTNCFARLRSIGNSCLAIIAVLVLIFFIVMLVSLSTKQQ